MTKNAIKEFEVSIDINDYLGFGVFRKVGQQVQGQIKRQTATATASR